MKKTVLVAAVAALSWVNAATADVVMTTSGAATMTSLGDAIGSPYDQLVIGGNGGVVLAPGSVLFNSMGFNVGINANVPHAGYSYSFIQTVDFGGPGQTVTIPFTVDISYADTITF